MADRLPFNGPVELNGGTKAAGTFGMVAQNAAVPFGVYEAAFEVDFEGTTITTNDNRLVKTVATLPAAVRIIEAYTMTSEAFDSTDEKGVDLVVTSTSPTEADVAIGDDVVQVITGIELKSGSDGALGSFKSASFSGAGAGDTTVGASGAGTHLCFINTDGSNDAHSITAGKVLVYIKYMSSAAAVANVTV